MAREPDYKARLREQQADEDTYNIVPKPVEAREDNTELGFLEEARDRASQSYEQWERNFKEAEDDVDFSIGNQWPEYAKQGRGDRACLTFNTIPQFLDQITGQQRQTRPAIHIHPADDHGAEIEFVQGKAQKRVKGAEIYEGIIRAIEYRSHAEAHYDTAFAHAADGGFGWLRVIPQYASGRSFDQELMIRSVKNRWAVLMDPDADEPDFADARYCFIMGLMHKREFEKRFPKAALGDFDAMSESNRKVWVQGNRLAYAEYMWREAKERDLLLLSNGQIGWADELEDVLPQMAAEQQVEVKRTRRVTDWSVWWQMITAHSMLGKKVKMPFASIPVVPVLGKEKMLRSGETLYRSAIRDAKDPKRAENFWLSAATDRIALAPKVPWVGTIEAIEGFEAQWQNANTGDASFLPYNEGHEAPRRADQVTMPAAEIQMSTIMVDRVKATIGMYDASLGARSNETSGRAIRARQSEANNGSFAFTDNLNRAIRRLGLLLLDAIPKVYDAERVMRLRNADGTDDWITVNQVVEMPDPKTGEMREVVTNALGQGEFDVIVVPGPAYSTQREEAADAMTTLLQAAPDLLMTMGDIYFENTDFPKADVLAKRMKRLIASTNPAILSPQELDEIAQEQQPEQQMDESGQPIPPQPSPDEMAAQQDAEMQAQMQQQAMAAQEAETAAKVADAEAKMMQAQADMAEAEAKMAQIQQEAALMQDEGAFRQLVRQEVADGIAAVMKTMNSRSTQ